MALELKHIIKTNLIFSIICIQALRIWTVSRNSIVHNVHVAINQ